MSSRRKHWNTIFSGEEESLLGWYEKDAAQTFKLLGHIPEQQQSLIFLPGAGTSGLIEELLNSGARLVVNDISSLALSRVKARLGSRAEDILWLWQDIAQPISSQVPDVDIWFDRAVLHFLIDEADISGYFNNLRSKLKVGAHAAFAEFSKAGATKCSGLSVHQYSVGEYASRLGTSFSLVTSFDYTHLTPAGDPKPYVYALFKKVESSEIAPET